MTVKKSKKYYEVKAYLQPDNDKELITAIKLVAATNNLSMSQVIGMALRVGVPTVGSTLSSMTKSSRKEQNAE